MDVLAIGPTSRDLVLTTHELPAPGTAVVADRRREVLGGKGALAALALARAGATPRLLSVVGDDQSAPFLVRGLLADGVDVAHLCRRPRTPTGLIVEILEPAGPRFVLDVPDGIRLRVADVEAATGAFAGVHAVIVSLTEPIATVRAAIGRARRTGAVVVVDGGIAPDEQPVLSGVDVLRADALEATRLAGRRLRDVAATITAAQELLAAGPRMVVLEVPGAGNVVAWRTAEHGTETRVVPLPDRVDTVDTTGAGDAFVAALTVAYVEGAGPEACVRVATEAAARVAGHPGGRLPPRIGRGA